ncbi:MAG: FecR domain-containing protein [Chitinophagaceae bacterium]
MNEDRFWLLISLKLSCEAQPEELSELETLLQEHPDLQLRAGMMQTIWSASAKNTTDKEAFFNKHMQRLSNHFSEPALQYEEVLQAAEEEAPRRRPLVRKLGWLTGMAALLALVIYLAYPKTVNTGQGAALAQNTVSTKKGSKSKIQLPDGTEVWLNADSKITYNEKFQGNIREVQLEGEAFFDVVRDESRPFIIHTDVIDVKVLGTAFNVRSYADEKNTETSLIRGLVEVTLRRNPDKKFTLKPNDKLIVANDSFADTSVHAAGSGPSQDVCRQLLTTMAKIRFTENESNALETLWVNNKLAFDKEPLEEIALKIERWYDVKVNITDKKLKRGEYSGVFQNESLQQVMEALQLSGGGDFSYTITRKEVLIYP